MASRKLYSDMRERGWHITVQEAVQIVNHILQIRLGEVQPPKSEKRFGSAFLRQGPAGSYVVRPHGGQSVHWIEVDER